MDIEREKMREIKKRFRQSLCAKDLTIDDIAKITDVDVETVREVVRGMYSHNYRDDFFKIIFLLFTSDQMREMAQILRGGDDYGNLHVV